MSFSYHARLRQEGGARHHGEQRGQRDVGVDPVAHQEHEPAQRDDHAEEGPEAEPLQPVSDGEEEREQRGEGDDDLARSRRCFLEAPEEEGEGGEEAEHAIDQRSDQGAAVRDRDTQGGHDQGEQRPGRDEPRSRRP